MLTPWCVNRPSLLAASPGFAMTCAREVLLHKFSHPFIPCGWQPAFGGAFHREVGSSENNAYWLAVRASAGHFTLFRSQPKTPKKEVGCRCQDLSPGVTQAPGTHRLVINHVICYKYCYEQHCYLFKQHWYKCYRSRYWDNWGSLHVHWTLDNCIVSLVNFLRVIEESVLVVRKCMLKFIAMKYHHINN